MGCTPRHHLILHLHQYRVPGSERTTCGCLRCISATTGNCPPSAVDSTVALWLPSSDCFCCLDIPLPLHFSLSFFGITTKHCIKRQRFILSMKALKQLKLTQDRTTKYCRPTNRTTGFDLLHEVIRSVVTGNDWSYDRSYTIVGKSYDRITSRVNQSYDHSTSHITVAYCVTATADRNGNRRLVLRLTIFAQIVPSYNSTIQCDRGFL